MRYSVEHLLEGVEAFHAQQIDQAGAELKAKRAELEKLEGTATAQVDKFAALLEGLAHTLRQFGEPFPHGATRDITRHVQAELERAKVRDLPADYTIEMAREMVAKQEERLAQVTAQRDGYEEEVAQFLAQLREGGETHVTASGFRLAGFDAPRLTLYLRARATRGAPDA